MADDQMSAERRPGTGKLWAPLVAVVAMILTAITIGFLLVPIYVVKLLHDTSGPVRSRPVAAEQTPADQTPKEPAALYRSPDDPSAHQISAFARPRPEPSPSPQPGAPSSPEDSSPSASEQRLFKSRKAIETLDARELVRQGTTQQ
jgi:hypothetical protein